jgi:hypothetical protein
LTTPRFGLYPQSDFRLTDGRCRDCGTIRQALWYFEREVIAVPKPGVPIASISPGLSADDDLRAWIASRPDTERSGYPPLVWVAAPDVVDGARLSPDATSVDCALGRLPLSLVPKIPLNRSYFDASSARFFHERAVRIRATIGEHGLVARTLWPEDFRLDRAPPPQPLDASLPATLALRALVRSEPAGGARSPYAVSTLWQRDKGRDAVVPGQAVLGIMVNGAQGDDDEAHAGHFALVTGRTDETGAIGDWLTNNFYSLDAESEKGILAAPVPLDNYLADLNSGQGWYRPSQMIVAVLRDARAPALVQATLNRVYNQFWRHQLVYRHATTNCTSISVDVLRVLGWAIPRRAPAGRLLAALAFPWLAIKDRSIAKASAAVDYLFEEQTRLLPAAAFEEIGASLLALASSSAGVAPRDGALARMLADDVEAILFVRMPQFPSSRAFGDAPVVSLAEYRSRLPPVPIVVPVPDRPFPDALRDADLMPAKRPPSAYAAAIWGVLSVVGIPLFLWRQWGRWRSRDRSAS